MNWEAVGAIGETIGAIALFLVLFQVRHAKHEMRRSVRSERTDSLLQLLHQYRDPRSVELRVRVSQALGAPDTEYQSKMMERAGITREEASFMYMEYMIWWQYYAEKVIRYVEDLSPADRFQADAAMRNIFGGPAGRLWFDTAKQILNPDAVGYIENLLDHASEPV